MNNTYEDGIYTATIRWIPSVGYRVTVRYPENGGTTVTTSPKPLPDYFKAFDWALDKIQGLKEPDHG